MCISHVLLLTASLVRDSRDFFFCMNCVVMSTCLKPQCTTRVSYGFAARSRQKPLLALLLYEYQMYKLNTYLKVLSVMPLLNKYSNYMK